MRKPGETEVLVRRVLLLIALSAVPATGAAQDSLEVGSSPTCPECRIVIEHIVTLGDTAGPGILPSTILSSVVRNRNFLSSL